METVAHHDRETAYEVADREADGPTICFVHGSGGTRSVWKSQHRIASHAPIVTLDLSGHGESDDVEATPGFTTLSAYADDVIAVAETTDADVLVGNSLGGAVVMHILLERREALDVSGAVLTGTGARLGVLEDLRWWLEHDFDRAVEFLHEPGRLFHDPDPHMRAASIAAMRECGQAITNRDYLTAHEFDVRDQLHRIDVPTLVVYGEHDRLTPPWFHEYLADEISDARLVDIEAAAHLGMLERPKPFNEALVSFLESV